MLGKRMPLEPAAAPPSRLPPPTSSAERLALAALPLGVLELIVSHLAVAADADRLYPVPFSLADLHRSLVPLKLVSRDWNAFASLLCARWASHVAWIDVSAAVARPPNANASGSSRDVHANASASDLRLVVRSVVTVDDAQRDTPAWCSIPTDYDDALQLQAPSCVVRSMGSIRIDWATLLQPRVTSLVRLDLSQMPLDCVHLGNVLLAASTACVHVRVLSLPKQTPRFSEDNEAREANLNELYGALQRWHRANGGLVHLRIPFGRFDENTSVRLLRALTAYCPDIEYLDGWQDTYRLHEDGQTSCDVYWPAPPVLWAAFWRSCTRLRAFNTVVMPFDDSYVDVFALARKSALETFHLALDSAKARHHEFTDASFSMMVFQMPNLQHLRLEIPFVRRDVWDPREAINNQLIQMLKSLCPLLRELRIQCADPVVLFDIDHLGFASLSKFDCLEILEIQRLRMLSPVFSAIALWGKPAMRVRLSFAAGQSHVWNLLRQLADRTPEATRSMMISLSLTQLPSRDLPWNEVSSFDNCSIRTVELEQLVERLQEKGQGKMKLHAHTKNPSNALPGVDVDLVHLQFSVNDALPRGSVPGQNHFEVRREMHCDSKCCQAQGIVID